jgi:hypothetical protein
MLSVLCVGCPPSSCTFSLPMGGRREVMLVQKIERFRVTENMEKEKKKKKS